MYIGNVVGDVIAWSAVVIYDSKSGEIVHVHQSITQKGGQHPDEPTLERQAAAQVALNTKVDPNQIAFLHVEPALLQKQVEYRIDPARRALVEKPAPASR
jgi:hypothetical protein